MKQKVKRKVRKAMKTWEGKLEDTELVLELVSKIMLTKNRSGNWRNQHGLCKTVLNAVQACGTINL